MCSSPRRNVGMALYISKGNGPMEVFLNGAEVSFNSANSGNLINHCSMNWAQFKYPVPHMCLACTVGAS